MDPNNYRRIAKMIESVNELDRERLKSSLERAFFDAAYRLLSASEFDRIMKAAHAATERS